MKYQSLASLQTYTNMMPTYRHTYMYNAHKIKIVFKVNSCDYTFMYKEKWTLPGIVRRQKGRPCFIGMEL